MRPDAKIRTNMYKCILYEAESVLTNGFYDDESERESGFIWTVKWASGEDVREPEDEVH
jgi:hypothetical protein